MTATSGIMLPATSINSAQSASSSSSSSSSSNTMGVTSSDFLTLLVTELKNQDPTATNDPNAYINQLVGINSLEQLISINQNLQTALGTTSSSVSSHVTNEASAALADQARSNSISTAAASQSANQLVNGNLSAPAASHAADRLTTALSGLR